MTSHVRRRALPIGLTALLVLAVSATPGGAATPDPGSFSRSPVGLSGTTITVPKSDSGRIAQSDEDLLARTDATPTQVMVKLDIDAAAAYSGGVDDLAPTSPSVTGKKLKKSDAAVGRYLAYTKARSDEAKAAIARTLPAATVTGTFDIVYGGLAVTLPANQAKDLLEVPGVVAVQADTLEQPLQSVGSLSTATDGAVDNDTTTFIGADAVWDSLGGRDHAGEGVIVGVLDTGIWPEHPMLADIGLAAPEGGPWACDFGNGKQAKKLGAAFSCNNKLIGAYAFLDTALAAGQIVDGEYCSKGVCTARDAEGHGTHTATTAAGGYVESASLLGVDRGPISGVAPGAHVIAYRVCASAGCFSSDSTAAVAQAVLDGVDVINFSISGGADAYSDPVELAFLDAYAAGISVNASAGNEGPGAATANHAGPWVTTVGASTSDRSFSSELTLTSSDGATFTKSGATITAGVTGRPVVLPSSVARYAGTSLCDAPFPKNSVKGKVVACERGGNARVEKGYNALQGGAAGFILYNPAASDVETDNHYLPAIHLEGPNDDFVAFLTGHPGVTATWAPGTVGPDEADVMAGFSSRGPLGDFLKPDITAPGVQVLAGHTPTPVALETGPAGQLYQAIAGTSMSSPHAAGVSTLLRAAHPDWAPGQVKSALMTSSVQSVTNADGSPAGVWDRGAGSIRADRAIAPVLTFDVSGDDYLASADDPLHRVDLNLPSLNVNPLPGALVTHRTVTNVSDATQAFETSVAVDGVDITVTPSSFSLAPGASQELEILVDGTGAAQAWYTGQVTLTPGVGVPVVLPVAVNVADAAVTLGQSCEPASIAVGETSACEVTATNLAPVEAPVSVEVQVPDRLAVTSADEPATVDGGTISFSGTLSPAIAPTITGVTSAPGSSPAGYLPLAPNGFGQPVSGVGDETITNYTVPSFKYGDEVYSSIGVVSDGYLVVGGGTSSDVSWQALPIPDPNAPNNVLAPFWTDLNPETGGQVLIDVLTDGVNNFLVVEFDAISPYSASSVDNSFQVWIQLGATEGIWFTYGALGGADPSGGLTIGAENRDGASGATVAEVPAPGSEYVVTTAGPTPGGSLTVGYQVSGVTPGTWEIVASLTSPILRATPMVRTPVTVTEAAAPPATPTE